MEQPVDLERLLDVVVGAALDRRDSRLHIAVPGDHHHRHVRVLALEHVEQLQTVQSRPLHPYVEKDQARAPACDFVEPAVGIVRLPRLIALILEDAGDQIADVVFVVDDQNIECHLCVHRSG